MHHILARGGQRFQMGAGNLHHVGLALRQEAELQQLGTKLIALARQEGLRKPRSTSALARRWVVERVRPMRSDRSASFTGPSITWSSRSSPR